MKFPSLFTAVLLSILLMMSERSLVAQLVVGGNSSNQSTNFTSGTNSFGTAIIGLNPGANNNTLSIANTNTLLNVTAYIYVGDSGSSNLVTISNGGKFFTGTAYLGYGINSSNNSVLVTGTNSLWSNGGTLNIGSAGAGNNLTITGGAHVVDSNSSMGAFNKSSNNSVLVIGTNSLWSNSSSLVIGGAGTGNNYLAITGGAHVVDTYSIIGFSNASSNNLVLVTGSGSLWSNATSLTIGESGSGNNLVISNGGVIADSVGIIGSNALSPYNLEIGNSSNNAVMVTGTNSLWKNTNSLIVGSWGAGNNLTIAGGAHVVDTYSIIGSSNASSNNLVLVTGTNSLWSNSASLVVGSSGPDNTFTVSAGAHAIDSYSIIGSSNNTSSNNSVLVTGPGSLWSNSISLTIGGGGSGNSLVISYGGVIADYIGTIGSSTISPINSEWIYSSNNSVVVTGTNSLWRNSNSLVVGSSGAGNNLTITGGAQAVDFNSIIGSNSTSSNNSVVVTGSGSLWSNVGTLTLGASGSGNSLVVSNGGVVDAYYGVIGAQSSNNAVLVTGSNSLWLAPAGLIVGASGTGTLTIARGGTVDTGLGIAIFSGSVGTVNVGTPGGSDSNVTLTVSAITFGSGTGTLNFNQSDIETVTSTISGIGTINQLGSGTTVLSASNSYSGTTSITNGMIEAASTTALGSSAVTLNGGSLTLLTNLTISSLVWNTAATVILPNLAAANYLTVTGALTLTGSGTNTFNLTGDTLGSSPVELLAWGSTNGGLTTNSFSVLGLTSYRLSISNNALWVTDINDLYVGSNSTVPSTNFNDSAIHLYRNTFVGYGNTASNNLLTIGNAGTVLTNTASLFIGNNGANNAMIVSNGASVQTTSNSIIGNTVGASNNAVLVTGPGSSWTNSQDLIVGNSGSGNNLTISNGGEVFNSKAIIGNSSSASNNSVLVTGSNSLWSNSGDLIVGEDGSGNSLVISNGGKVSNAYSQYGAVIGLNADSSNNSVLVTGPQSLLSNALGIMIGSGGSGNSLAISNSGVVASGYGVLGANSSSSNNSFIVTGEGSLWSNVNTLTVGQQGNGTLTVANGAMVVASSITIASQAGSSGTLNIGGLGTNDSAASLTTPTINFGAGTGMLNFNQSGTATISSTISSGIVESTRVVPEMTTNGTVYKMVVETQLASGGTDSVNQLGSGTTILSGNNSYSGTTTINAGTLQTASTDALGTSTVSLNGGTLALSTNLTISSLIWNSAGVIALLNASSGQYLRVSNSVTLIGTGTNSFDLLNYTLSATPTELLAFGTNAVTAKQFDVLDLSNYLLFTSNNALWIRQYALIASNNITTITGTNTYPQTSFQPGGVLNVTTNGNLTITGGVNVTNNGTVTLNGTLNAPFVYVASGGTLGGSGLLNGNLTNNGTVSPGNSPGTLTVHGNYTQTQNGSLLIQIASPSDFDQVIVSGKALLGGRLIVTPYNGYQFAFGQKFGFLTAASIKGSFSEIDAPAGYRTRLTIVGDPVAYINFAPVSYTQLAASPNQYQVAKALDSFIPATSGDQLVVSTTLDSLTASQYQAAFNAIAPTIYQSESTIAFNLANAQNQELLQRLWGVRIAGTGFSMSGFADNTMMVEGQGDGTSPSYGKSVLDSKKDILRPGADNHWGMFVDGNGIFATANSGNMLPNYNSQSGGVTTGMTYKWNDSFGTGIYAGYEGSYAKYGNNASGLGGGSSLIDNSVRFGFFGTYGHPDGKGFYADGLIGGGYNNYQVSRNISFGSLNRTANSTPGAGELDSMLAGGYDIKRGNWTYGPTTSLQYTYFGANPVNETGAQSLDFTSSGWNTSSLLYSLGAHVAYIWQANKDILVVPQISLSWQHEFLQSPYSVNGSLGGSPTFSNTSATPIRDTLYTGVGFTVELYKKWNTSLFYNASAGNSDLTSQNIFWSAGMKF